MFSKRMEMGISKQEQDKSIKNYLWIMLKWNIVSIVGFFSTLIIWAFILKHIVKLDIKFWLLNDTVDGDYGADWWLKREGLQPSLWSAFRWWLRNHSWNFIYKYLPHWKAGKANRFNTVKCTIPQKDLIDGRWTKANHLDNIYGVNYYFYELENKVYFNYSKANAVIEMQFGAGGNEYRFWIKTYLLSYLKSKFKKKKN